MPQPIIHITPQSVDEALKGLGLVQAQLLEAITEGILARTNCTPNDPPFFPGQLQWARTVRVLREVLAPLGWRRSNKGNFCTVVEPGKRFAIAVATGNDQTGVDEDDDGPSTKRRRGPHTAEAVGKNATVQLLLFTPEELEQQDAETPDGAEGIAVEARATWILLFLVVGDEIRAELSLPDSIDEDGRIDGWRVRIILDAQRLGDGHAQPAPDFGPDPTIDVRRRA